MSLFSFTFLYRKRLQLIFLEKNNADLPNRVEYKWLYLILFIFQHFIPDYLNGVFKALFLYPLFCKVFFFPHYCLVTCVEVVDGHLCGSYLNKENKQQFCLKVLKIKY